MDYDMVGVDVEASVEPYRECRVRLLSARTLTLDPGGQVLAQVAVEAISGGALETYSVNVTRLGGSETTLKALEVAGAVELQPSLDPLQREYLVMMDVSRDVVAFHVQRLDSGQAVSLEAGVEEVVPKPNGEVDAARSRRRLADESAVASASLGQVQASSLMLLTTLDIGQKRVVKLVVVSADQSATGTYRFVVQRPFCPESESFFDGAARRCTDICNQGSFGNPETGRCAPCARRNCAVCDTAGGCSACMDGYRERLDGGCAPLFGADAGGISNGAVGAAEGFMELEAAMQKYSRGHQALMLGAAGVGTVACCTCLFLSGATRGRISTWRRSRPLLSIDDDDMNDEDSYRSY